MAKTRTKKVKAAEKTTETESPASMPGPEGKAEPEWEEAHGDVLDVGTADRTEAQVRESEGTAAASAVVSNDDFIEGRVPEPAQTEATEVVDKAKGEAPSGSEKTGKPVKARRMIPPAKMLVGVDRLREVLGILEPAVPKRANLPVLVYARLGEGRAVATDLEVGISLALPEAREPLLVPHRRMSEFLKYVPGHLTATLEVDNGPLKITAGGTQASFDTGNPADYPPLAGIDMEPEERGVLGGDDLVRALRAVAPYTAKEDSRPVLTAVALKRGEEVEAVAADGFRLVWEEVTGKLPGSGMLLIPRQAVAALEYLWKRSPAPAHAGEDMSPAQAAVAKRLVLLEWKGQTLRVRFGGDQELVLVVHMVEGTFPSYGQLIPKPTERSFTAMADDLQRAINQLAGVARDGAGIVRLQWGEGELRLSASGESIGDVRVSLAAKMDESGRTALNLSYFEDYLKGKDGAITLAMTGPESSPVLITYQGRSNHVIMPMFVQW